jgi:hypothetical protein
VNTEEKLALAFHRNCLILLGKLSLRQIVTKLLKWLLTEMLEFESSPGSQNSLTSINYRVCVEHSVHYRMVGDDHARVGRMPLPREQGF